MTDTKEVVGLLLGTGLSQVSYNYGSEMAVNLFSDPQKTWPRVHGISMISLGLLMWFRGGNMAKSTGAGFVSNGVSRLIGASSFGWSV